MGTLFLVTCGTSLLTNNVNDDEKKKINKLTNEKEEELTPDDKRVLDEILNRAKKCLSDNRPEDHEKTGAEHKSIETYIKKNQSSCDSAVDQYYLLHTDTYLGQRTSELLQDFFIEKFGLIVMTHKMTKVNTSSERQFHEGCCELAKWMTETLPGFKKQNYRIVFNLTGGFKSLQGVMQTMGNFFADETVYIFEGAKELIQIPHIPLNLNSELKTLFEENLSIFRRISANDVVDTKDLSESENNFVKKQTLLFDRMDTLTSLSPWGILCWGIHKDEIYRSSLLDSPSPCIRFSDRFRAEANNHDFVKELNERVDDFLAFLGNNSKNTKRLDFKPIKGNHSQFGNTHECDAWSASPGYRIFMRKENQTWIFDTLAPGINH